MTTTRGVTSGSPTRPHPGAGPDTATDLLPVPAKPASVFHLHAQRLVGIGQICLACGDPILTAGWRLHRAELMETHAHAQCVDAALGMLCDRSRSRA